LQDTFVGVAMVAVNAAGSVMETVCVFVQAFASVMVTV
jgi:hypothetical protein